MSRIMGTRCRSLAGLIGLSVAVASAAGAAPIVDGVLGSGEYGAGPTATVGYNPAAPTSNFGAPTNFAADVGYDIYLQSDGSFYYGLFQARPDRGGSSVGPFANIYLDLDPRNGNGSDLGFELSVGAKNAFVPGMSGSVSLSDIIVAQSGDGLTLEFAIPTSRLTGPIAGLTYYPGQEFPTAANPDVVLRLSQSFGYSVAGGATYGDDRLGRVSVVAATTAVPEPASAALLLAGLAGAGLLRRRRAA